MLDVKETAAKMRPTSEKKQNLRAFFLFSGSPVATRVIIDVFVSFAGADAPAKDTKTSRKFGSALHLRMVQLKQVSIVRDV